MKNSTKYNIFLTFSNLFRNLVEVFNIVLLYKLGFNIKEILLYYLIFFLFGILVNITVIYLTNYIKPKYILMLSNILFCLSYYYLSNIHSNITNLIIFSILSSLSSYTYHIIRHYYAFKYTNSSNSEIGNILIFSYLGIILSSYIGPYIIDKYSIFIVIIIMFILSIFSLIPIIYFKEKIDKEKIMNIKINNTRKIFFIFEQSKVLFLIIQPLYLYLYISDKLKFIGIFNIINCIASVLVVYYIVRKIKINKYFKYINILLIIILILKLNIINKTIILVLAFFEGLFIKIYEIVSMKNLYQLKITNIKSYLLKVEIIFCLTRGILMLIFYLFIGNIKTILYILLLIILLSSFIIKTDV